MKYEYDENCETGIEIKKVRNPRCQITRYLINIQFTDEDIHTIKKDFDIIDTEELDSDKLILLGMLMNNIKGFTRKA